MAKDLKDKLNCHIKTPVSSYIIAAYGASVITPAQAKLIIGINARTFDDEGMSLRVIVDCATPADVPSALENCVQLSVKHPNVPMLLAATLVLPGDAVDGSPDSDLSSLLTDIEKALLEQGSLRLLYKDTYHGPDGPYSTVGVIGCIGGVYLDATPHFTDVASF